VRTTVILVWTAAILVRPSVALHSADNRYFSTAIRGFI